MERLVDVAVELWRIVKPSGLFREARAATLMFADSFGGDLPDNAHDGRSYTKTIIFTQGILLSIFYYRSFVDFFHKNGVRVVYPLDLKHNIISYSQGGTLISDTIKREEDKTGKLPEIVCHSWGGRQAKKALAEHPEIERFYFIATPFRGPSLGALNLFMTLLHGSQDESVGNDVFEDPEILKKIVTIASYADQVVPPHEAALPGAHAEIVIEQDYAKQSTWDSHTGLPYHARHKLLELLSEKRTEQAA